MLPVWEKQHLFRPTKRRWRGCRVSPLLILPLLACGCITFTLLRVLLESSAEPEDAARPDREVPLPPSLPLSAMTHSDALAAMYAASALGAARSAAQAAQACGQGAIRYTLLAVADQDERSVNHSSGELVSSLLRGTLCDGRDSGGSLSVTWGDAVPLRSHLAASGRGMELSTLTWFGGRLLSCDDRTGIVYEISKGEARPRHILAGPTAAAHFKCEWAAVRHGQLYVGGIGRPFHSPSGATTRNDLVATIDTAGVVSLRNFSAVYDELCRAAGCGGVGYATHEAAAWVGSHGEVGSWYFAPRRLSSEPFDEALDETRAGRTLLRYSAPGGRDGGHPVSLLSPRSSGLAGAHVSAVPLGGSSGAADPSRGVSALKLLPGRRDVLVALKTEESGGRVASFLSILRSESGEALMPDAEVAQGFKFEGLEVSVPTYV